jgi:hypothetical protein
MHTPPTRPMAGVALLDDSDQHMRRPEDPESAWNLLLRGRTSNAPARLNRTVARFLHTKPHADVQQCFVVDLLGRHTASGTRGVRLTAGRHPLLEPEDVLAPLSKQDQHVVVDMSALRETERSDFVARMLLGVQQMRAWRDHPQWIVLDDAQDVLTDPNMPPEALRLADRGYCLIDRGAEPLPDNMVQTLGLTRVVPESELPGPDPNLEDGRYRTGPDGPTA